VSHPLQVISPRKSRSWSGPLMPHL